jgi:hypothetical protein
MGKFQRQPGDDEANKGHHHRKMEDNVEEAKPTIDVTCLIGSYVLREEDPLGP